MDLYKVLVESSTTYVTSSSILNEGENKKDYFYSVLNLLSKDRSKLMKSRKNFYKSILESESHESILDDAYGMYGEVLTTVIQSIIDNYDNIVDEAVSHISESSFKIRKIEEGQELKEKVAKTVKEMSKRTLGLSDKVTPNKHSTKVFKKEYAKYVSKGFTDGIKDLEVYKSKNNAVKESLKLYENLSNEMISFFGTMRKVDE